MKAATKLVAPGVVAIAAIVGLAVGNSLNASGVSAATTSSTNASTSSTQSAFADPTQGGHVGSNGTKEVLLTGDTADKVKTAALAAVPGGTIQRMENDAEGATYEAHMTKADGSQVTVKLDASFTVTSTDAGMGGGGHDQKQ